MIYTSGHGEEDAFLCYSFFAHIPFEKCITIKIYFSKKESNKNNSNGRKNKK